MSGHGSYRCPPRTESPFAPRGRYPLRGNVLHSLSRGYFGLHRSYWLMRRTKLLSAISSPYTLSPCRLLRAPAATRPFPTLSLRCFRWMLGPLSRRADELALSVSSPINVGLPPRSTGRLSRNTPHGDFCTVFLFGTAVIPLCSGLQLCSPPRSLPPQPALRPAGQPWLLLPNFTWFVTSPCVGYN